ncbi:MAG TPA: hypothetical protein VLB79_13695 [Solirubrobacterales bacterium]|nr:hypothetical protein [Solirubrobacterales bacterium]
MPTTTADPATATARSRPTRRHRVLAAALALAGAAALAACGGNSGGAEMSGPAAPSNPAAFAFVHPTPTPAGWRTRKLPSGQATLAYPRTWRLTRTDPGTVTATVRRGGQIAGYLNITPQGGEETLSNWASFRPAHNREEGDRNLVPLASAGGLRFSDGRGSCVKDSYSTETNRRYIEVACIVRGAAATTVIVGATTPGLWESFSPTLERAISSFDATA